MRMSKKSGWLHGEVDAFDSHVKRVTTSEICPSPLYDGVAQALDPIHLELISALLSHAHLIAVPGHRYARFATARAR